jgi:hypothetical protein
MNADAITEWIHIGLALLGLIVSAAGAWLILIVKNNQAETKAELTASQTKMQIDMDAKHAENRQAIAVHMAEDKAIFGDFTRRLDKQDVVLNQQTTTLSRIEAKVTSRGSKA